MESLDGEWPPETEHFFQFLGDSFAETARTGATLSHHD